MTPDLSRYDHAAVRDLVWALSTPSLMNHEVCVDDHETTLDVLRHPGVLSRLDQPGSDLLKAVGAMRGNRLGDYFEILIETWLRQLPEVHFIASNVQVHGARGTIGEFDMLFERDRTFWHWELATKFYLGIATPDGPRWLGPNPRDRLDGKWQKMVDKQLVLAKRRSARGVLRRFNLRFAPEARAFIKGYLFEPLSEIEFSEHPDANPHTPRGWWVHHRFLRAHRGDVELTGPLNWVVLPRLRWLAPARAQDASSLFDFDELAIKTQQTRPSLVAGIDPETGLETTRGFVVHDNWPQKPPR